MCVPVDRKDRAIEALATYYAWVIRQDHDPDHSGPEDAADMLATVTVAYGLLKLAEDGYEHYLELRQ